MGNDTSDPTIWLVFNVEPDGKLWWLLRLHSDDEDASNWCVVRHGKSAIGQGRAANKVKRPSSTPRCLHASQRNSLCRAKCAKRERQATLKGERKGEASKKKERKATSTCAQNLRVCCLFYCHETIGSLRCPRVCTRLLLLWCPMSWNSRSSHDPWQDSTWWWHSWRGAWQAWDDSSATVSFAQNPEQASDERLTIAVRKLHEQVSHERVMRALHTMQDHCHRRQ